jgi:sec-independent protein translocase protein TatA
MGALSWTHILLILVVVLLLFGKGKISDLMGDFAKGIKSFKKGMSEDDQAAANPPAGTVQGAATPPGGPVVHDPKIIEHKTVEAGGSSYADKNRAG